MKWFKKIDKKYLLMIPLSFILMVSIDNMIFLSIGGTISVCVIIYYCYIDDWITKRNIKRRPKPRPLIDNFKDEYYGKYVVTPSFNDRNVIAYHEDPHKACMIAEKKGYMTVGKPGGIDMKSLAVIFYVPEKDTIQISGRSYRIINPNYNKNDSKVSMIDVKE